MAVAVLAVSAAAAARWFLNPLLGDIGPYSTFYVAVAFAAWWGGWRPAAVAAVLASSIAVYLFAPPRFAYAGISRGQIANLVMFLVACAAIAAFAEGMWRSRRALADSARDARSRATLLRTTFASVGDGIVTTDADGRVKPVDPQRLTDLLHVLAAPPSPE